MSDSAQEPRQHRPPVDLAGRVLDGRYRVEALLGAGGMGAVYRAWQITLEKQVAIKVLKPDYADREDAVKRFLREARAASKIGHPNVVEVVDFGQTQDGLVYFVMEFLEGEDLAKMMRREAPLAWRRAKPILLQIVRALKAAHAKGIVHRDVKPANCFLVHASDEAADWVKVLDFGIAKVITAENAASEGLTSTSQVMGTALYMAPEQAMGRTIDVRTDIYALGVMAFEMLTGRQPFTGATTFEVLMKRMSEPPPMLRLFRPTLGAAVEQLLQRLMAREPVARYQSMKEVESALVEIADDIEDDAIAPRTVDDAGIEDAPPTATSARHRPGAVSTLPYGEAVQSEPERQVMLLDVGEPTEAAPSVEVAPVRATVVAVPDTISLARPRRGWVVPVAIAGVLAIGFGAWWTFGRGGMDDEIEKVAGAEVESDEAKRRDAARASDDAKVDDDAKAIDGVGDDADAKAIDGVGNDAGAEAIDDKKAIDDAKTIDDAKAIDDAQADDGESADDSSADGADAGGTPEVGTPPDATDPRRDKTKKHPVEKPALTDASVESRLRRRARTACKGGASGERVVVKFLVDAAGGTAMVRTEGSTADPVRIACVVALVERAHFPPGEPRSRSLSVSL